MNKQELELEVQRLMKEISRRDHLLRRCYFAVRQIRDNGHAKLMEEMAEWRNPTPEHLHPRMMSKGAQA
jgi:hypothetical protein